MPALQWIGVVVAPLVIWLHTAPIAVSNDLTPEQALRQALASARAISDPTQRESALHEVLWAAQRVKAVDFLLEMAGEASQIRQQVLQVVVPILAGGGRIEKATAYWRQIEDADARAQTLAYACGAAAAKDDWKGMQRLFAVAQGHKQRAQCLDAVVNALLQEEKSEDALRYALQIGEPQRSTALARVAESLARHDKIQLALQAASRVKGGGNSREGFSMNLAIAGALAKAGKVTQAMERLKRAVEMAQRVSEEEGVLRYERLAEIPYEMPVVLTPSQWNALAARIRAPDERATLLQAACRRYGEERKWQHARAIVNFIPTASDKIPALVMLSSIARGAGRKQDAQDLLRRADALLAQVKGGEARDNALRELAVEMAAAGNLPRAVALAALVREGVERFNLFGNLLDEAKRRDIRPEERPALQKLAQLCLKASAPDIPKEIGFPISLQHVPVVRAGTALALAGDIEGVRRLLQRQVKPEQREDMLRGILAELSVERIDHEVPVPEYPVLHWLSGGTMPEDVPTRRHHGLIRKLIDSLADPSSRTKLQQEYLSELPVLSDEIGLNEQELTPHVRRELVWKLCQAGQLEQATRLALSEENAFARSDLLNVVAEGLLKHDRVEDALRLLREHNVLHYGARSEVLQLLVQKGHDDEALQLVRDAPAQMGNPLTGRPMPVRAGLRFALTKYLWENGQRERALALIRETMQQMQGEPPSMEQVRLLTYIAELLAGR